MTPEQLREIVQTARNRVSTNPHPHLPLEKVVAAKKWLNDYSSELALLVAELGEALAEIHNDLHQWKRRGAPTSQIFLFWQDRVLWQHRSLGKVPARAVKKGTIVRFKGEWGVLESGRFCSWEGPAFRLRPDELVEVLVERKKKKR